MKKILITGAGSYVGESVKNYMLANETNPKIGIFWFPDRLFFRRMARILVYFFGEIA